MPILRNPRHERFCQELAAGKSAAEAYREAGYRENRSAAARLRQDERICRRVTELLAQRERIEVKAVERAIEKTAITKAWVIERLRENVERAMQIEPVRNAAGEETGEYRYQGAVANRALELLGRELHMFVERTEQGKPGEFERMTREEAERGVVEELVKGGISEEQAWAFIKARGQAQ